MGDKSSRMITRNSLLPLAIVPVLWVTIGFSLAFGDDLGGIIGNPASFPVYMNVGNNPDPILAPDIPLALYAFFQMMFAIITISVIAGATAESCNPRAWSVFIILWLLLVYCPLAHMVWHPKGLLYVWGYVDFAGGVPVEIASGVSAGVVSLFLGPCKTAAVFNAVAVTTGTAILLFGWFGFNAGCVSAMNGLTVEVAVNTLMAASTSFLTSVIIEAFLFDTANIVVSCSAIVIGLVAVTPACGYVTIYFAMLIGVIACIVSFVVAWVLQRVHIEDVLEVFSAHGVAGIVGVLLTGCFCSSQVNPNSPDGLVYGNILQFGKHLAVVVCVIPYVSVMTYGILMLIDLIIPVRMSLVDLQKMEGYHLAHSSIEDGDDITHEKETLVDDRILI